MQKSWGSARISELFECVGREIFATPGMSQTDHALHCATRAENAGESSDLIVAALLHDVGHMLMAESRMDAIPLVELPVMGGESNQDFGGREIVAAKRAARKLTLATLQGWLPDNAVAAVRLLHPAKHYLCAVEDDYWDALTPATQAELLADGGRYDAALVARFRQYPCHAAAVRLRRYDDLAKQNSIAARPLSHFMQYIRQYAQRDAYPSASLFIDSNVSVRPIQETPTPYTVPPRLSPSRHLSSPGRVQTGANV
jgi:predicted HD phosphohydrolase